MSDEQLSGELAPRGKLFCKACGNDELFVEIMDFEAHLVDRNLVYRRLLHAELDHYECYLCGAEIDYEEDSEISPEHPHAPV